MSWRDIARPIIADVLSKTEHSTPQERKKALFDAYPFGERRYHPYKIWLDEIKAQLGLKKTKSHGHTKAQLEDHGQITLAERYGTVEIK